MVKAGPIIRIKPWRITLNPYIGYAWERINTEHAYVENDSLLYGLNANWHWRMLNVNVKYYYQDSLEDNEDTSTFRTSFVGGISKHWAFTVRFDYMEHMTTDDIFVMAGPVYIF